MADAVTARVLFSNTNSRKYIVHLTCISDATGETNVVKVDRSALTNPNGVAPDKVKIASIRWNTQGFSYLKLSWHAYTDATHTLDDVAMLLNGNGYENFEQFGCLINPNTVGTAISGSIGDLLLTSVGAASGATYDVTIECVI